MAITLIAEGSYPYIAGGVSTWIHHLVKDISDQDFRLLSIMPDPNPEPKLELKYEIPDNIVFMETQYLNTYLELRHSTRRREPRLSKKEKEVISDFLFFKPELDWKLFAETITNKKKMGTALQFLRSRFFWEIVRKRYLEEFYQAEFNAFFWTIRSMLLPVLHILQADFNLETDAFHCVSTGYAGLIGIVLAQKTGLPLILTEHGIYAREREEEIIKSKWVQGAYKRLWIEFFYFISIGVYHHAQKVITLFYHNHEIQVELGAAREKSVVIPNGVNMSSFPFIEQVATQNVVATVTRVVPIKDIMTLIRSFKLVVDRRPEAKLLIIGPTDEDPDYYRNCLNLVSLLGLDEQIDFTGRVNVREYLPQIDLMLLTSISEGQPLTILESMSSGVPFVASNVGSCQELLYGAEGDEFGRAGLITPPVSPAKTAEAIMELLENLDLRREMSSNGRARIEAYYTNERLVESYRKVYGDVQ